MKFQAWNLVLIFFLLGCSSPAQTDEDKARELIVKNKIKSVTEFVTEVHMGMEDKEHISRVKLFNTKGFITKETTFSPSGEIESYNLYEYDKKDNLVVTTGLNKDSGLVFRETRNYDNNNKRNELYFYLPEGTYKYRNIAKWDNKGRMTELAWYWTTGFRSKNTFVYNGNNMTEKAEYNAEGKLEYKWTYKYDNNGNPVEAIQYAPDNSMNYKITYEYKNNQVIKQIDYNRGEIQKMVTYEYDNRDLLILKTEFLSVGRIAAKYRYLYG